MMASVFEIKLRWLTLTSRGIPVEPEVGINAANSSSLREQGTTESGKHGSHKPANSGRPFLRAQSHWFDLELHAALAPAFWNTKSPDAACVRSSRSIGTIPAYIAPI